MRGVEVDGVDMCGRARQVGEHVAAARRDGDDPMAFHQVHGLDVDLGVFPYLRIDQAGEEKREQPLGKPGLGERAVLVDGLAELAVFAEPEFAGKVGHGNNSPFADFASGYRGAMTGRDSVWTTSLCAYRQAGG